VARKKPEAEPAVTPEKEETPMSTIVVQGSALPVSTRYAEGHVLTAIEAGVLNQTLFENMRNNFASKIKAARTALGLGDDDILDTSIPYSTTAGEGEAAVTTEHKSIDEQWAEHSEAYQFGVRRVGGGTGKRVGNPYEREALRLAKAAVEKKVREKYGKLNAVPKETLDALIEQHSKSEAVVAKAKENVDALGDIDLGIEV
jgi:hypothetical protein